MENALLLHQGSDAGMGPGPEMPAQLSRCVLAAKQRRLPGTALRQAWHAQRSINRPKELPGPSDCHAGLQKLPAGEGLYPRPAKRRQRIFPAGRGKADTINK